MTDVLDRLRYRMKDGPGWPAIIGYSAPGVTLEQDVTEAIAEIERQRVLADAADELFDSADIVLRSVILPIEQVRRWKARYREARQR